MAALLDRRATPLMLGLLFGLFAVALGLMLGDNPAEQALFAARWTARAALPLFLVAYLANSLLRLWRGDITRALMRWRRQWGLGFALAHTIHLMALGINVLVFAPREPATVIAGGIAYGMIYLMALTSNDASMRAMGKWWKRMHSFGIHYTWLIFTLSYAGRFTDGDANHYATAIVLAPVMFGALGLRLYARFGRRRVAAV